MSGAGPNVRGRDAATWPWWLLFALAGHGAFSWIGFNPTDEGWLQAVARRLVDGEVPHRDFIFVRPALSAYLQAPLVLWGGEQVLWLARLWGWLTLAASVWIWSGLAGARGWSRPALALGATLAAAHTFPVMAWHTLDGLLLASAGIWFAHQRRLAPAFLLLGCAGLCRQNLGLLAPLLALACALPWRGWATAALWSVLPVALYVAGLAAVGGADEFVTQLLAVRGAFLATAVLAWVQEPAFWGGLLAGALAAAALRRRPELGGPLFLLAGVGLAVAIASAPSGLHRPAFALTGAVATLLLARRERFLGLAGLGLVWVTTISSGYNQPSLAAGVLVCLLWRATLEGTPPPANPLRALGLAAVAASALAVAVASARWRWPYCDAPASRLQWDAGDALPGARGLRTNTLTAATLAELARLADDCRREGRTYVVLTDCAAHWIRSPQRNPLRIDWAQGTELADDPALLRQVVSALDALPPGSRAIVQKYFIAGYGLGLQPLREVAAATGWYRVQTHVEGTWTLVAEDRFFAVYERPAAPRPTAGPG